MRRFLWQAMAMLFMAAGTIPAAQNHDRPFPASLLNAHYVYVSAYGGDSFNPRLLPEDRRAIRSVQDELKDWGRFAVVQNPRMADIHIKVMARRSEVVLDVYDARLWPRQTYLWRATGPAGEEAGERELVERLREAVELADEHR